MSARLRATLLVLALALPMPVVAGTACRTASVTPAGFADAAATATWAYAALEERDAPVALIARAGTDLGKYGLHYSHVGFVVRDHPDGRWTVIHLLNECGTDRSGLRAQGLVNFFVDDLVNQDARIVWLSPAYAERLARELAGPAPLALHEPHYNVISRPDRTASQNSTGWVLDVLADARGPEHVAPDRRLAQARQRADGFAPDTLRIPYSQRVLGGLFAANADFGEHSVSTRFGGEYPVVTVRSIFRWLEQLRLVDGNRERRAGRDGTVPGPA